MSTQEILETKLTDYFLPLHLEVLDESHMHNVPEGSESHFKITIVTTKFENLMLIKRHREINQVLAEEIKNKIHALALHTMTPEEWFEKGGNSPDSPLCLGGGKKEETT